MLSTSSGYQHRCKGEHESPAAVSCHISHQFEFKFKFVAVISAACQQCTEPVRTCLITPCEHTVLWSEDLCHLHTYTHTHTYIHAHTNIQVHKDSTVHTDTCINNPHTRQVRHVCMCVCVCVCQYPPVTERTPCSLLPHPIPPLPLPLDR